MTQDLLLTYYGDDFTGSTDALEALTLAGVRAVLFLKAPTPEALAAFPGVQAVGVAGNGRSLTPSDMDEAFPALFARLKALGAPVSHYKTCSTFDSSPEIGSIGRAADLGHQVFRCGFLPLLVGAPALSRYCVFGNLFARSGPESEVFRLDRHPTMSRHPVTPMTESDLRLHLGQQTAKRIDLFDILQYRGPPGEVDRALSALLDQKPDIVLFDILSDEQLAVAGRLIWERASVDQPLFAIGSSGVEYALTGHWRASGLVDAPAPPRVLEPAPQLLALSGSCSPVTERQIDAAAQDGFEVVPLATAKLVDPERSAGVRDDALGRALDLLGRGRSVILHSCLGPQDPRIGETVRQFEALGYSRSEVRLKSGRVLGEQLGKILGALLQASGVRRVVVAGGDTSSYIASELSIEALEMVSPLATGAPLCRAHARQGGLDGLEIAFKGGQTGKTNFFSTALRGNQHEREA